MVPALAVADALRAEGAEVAFIGAGRAEAQMVPAAGYALERISVEGLSRSSPLRALRAVVRAAAAVPRARRLLRRLGADAVMGGGGYVSAPVVLAAVTLRVPVVLTEADSRLGLTNRAFAPLVRRVCLSFPPPPSPSLAPGRRAKRYRVTGRPTYPPASERAAARERFGIGGDESCLLVFGGSLGARSINLAAIEAFAGASFRVLHVCGQRDYEELAQRPLRAGYTLYEYLDPATFAEAQRTADASTPGRLAARPGSVEVP